MEFGEILDLARSMGLILGLAFYVAIVLWTYKDVRKRVDDPMLVAAATAVSMLPVVGVLIYMLLRPSEYLADVRERELEIRALERQLGRQERCPYCKSHIEGEYLSCPVCTTKLRQTCGGCERPLDPRWMMCPFCETEVPNADKRRGSGGSGGAAAKPARPQPAVEARDSSPQDVRPRRAESKDRSSKRSQPKRESSSVSSKPESVKSSKPESKPSTSDVTTEPFDAEKTTASPKVSRPATDQTTV